VRPPLPLLRGKKWKALINLRKSENDVLKIRSVKKSKSLLDWSAHDHCAFCCLRHKSVQLHGIVEFYLAGGTGLLTATGKPTEIATIEIFHKHMLYVFYKNHICFFLSVLKKTKTHSTYIVCVPTKTLKHNVRTTLQLAYHGCKNFTHTSKTRQVKTHPNGCNC